MNYNKEEVLKEILGIRRRLNAIERDVTREIDIFEEQMEKSLRRIDKISYLAKKFSAAELQDILDAYEALLNAPRT